MAPARPDGFESHRQPDHHPEAPDPHDWVSDSDDELAAREGGEEPFAITPVSEFVEPESPVGLPAPRLTRPDGSPVLEPVRRDPAAPPARQAWTGKGTSVPRLQIVTASRAGATPAADVEEDELEGAFLGAERSFETEPSAKSAGPALRPLEEPWWMVWLEALLTSRRLQAAVLAGLVALATVVFWPRQEPGVPLSRIRKHPETFEGQTIRVRGKVGDVFSLGSGHVFQLLQGRDTVVVFTHQQPPERHQRVEVSGSVSTGYLDGRPRVALFVSPSPAP